MRDQPAAQFFFPHRRQASMISTLPVSYRYTYKTIIRPIVTYGRETWAMTVTEQNRLRVFERRVLRKIYGPTLDKDGTWRIKTNEELENLIKEKNIV
jgi:hypothetical protein